jgi:lipopolysaccharide transport system permease protein
MLVQMMTFLSFVPFLSTEIKGRWAWARWWGTALNPIAGVVEGFRWTLLGVDKPDALAMTISVVMSVLLLLSGLFYFRRVEQSFADVI